jgi:alpha-beta hydrolase superfamily lysophospholipase
MELITEQGGAADGYEVVTLPGAAKMTGGLGSAVFLRRSTRPSRRAVLHLHDLTDSFAPADLARWYNERGFHFYVADLDPQASLEPARRRPARSRQSCFDELDSACAHLRDADGIDAIILSAQASAGLTAALWCDARREIRPVDALILSSPEFGRGLRSSLDIACPVLVISASDGLTPLRPPRRERRASDAIRLGQHVTWLHLDQGADDGTAPGYDRKRLFDEMGRWLGAYMYGQLRDQLL